MLTIWDGLLISSQWFSVVLPSSLVLPPFFCLLCFVHPLQLYGEALLYPAGVQLTHTQVGENPKLTMSCCFFCFYNGDLNALNAFTTFNHYLTLAHTRCCLKCYSKNSVRTYAKCYTIWELPKLWLKCFFFFPLKIFLQYGIGDGFLWTADGPAVINPLLEVCVSVRVWVTDWEFVCVRACVSVCDIPG